MAIPVVVGGEHVSQYCVRVDFDIPMRNDANFRTPANYTFTAPFGPVPTVTAVMLPSVHDQPYVPGPTANGGLPKSAYLFTDIDIATTLADTVVVNVAIVEFYGTNLIAPANEWIFSSYVTLTNSFWAGSGLKKNENAREVRKLGAKFNTSAPVNKSMLDAFSFLADLIGGGFLSTVSAIDGPLEVADQEEVSFSPGGFSLPASSIPGLGDIITFGGNGIIPHVERLWGNCDGSNDLFRTSLPYHSFCCTVILVESGFSSAKSRILETTEWFSPLAGDDNLIRIITPPREGSSLLIIYSPKQSIIRVDKEIIAYGYSNPYSNTAEIIGRSQLCTELEEHASGTVCEDVWQSSMLGRAQHNLLVFGASGRPLEYLAELLGPSRSENPSLHDTALRRAIFNTSVGMRGNNGSFELAMRYIFPDLWAYISWTEDPRWPKCVVVWYSDEPLRGFLGSPTGPAIEPWETWLDFNAYGDGFDDELLAETYIRDPIGDTSYEGDHFLEDAYDDPEDYQFPVVISGPTIGILGVPHANLFPPSSVSLAYKTGIVRSERLDRVLPVGIGLLIYEYGAV